jgi:hypothetical protein
MISEKDINRKLKGNTIYENGLPERVFGALSPADHYETLQTSHLIPIATSNRLRAGTR